MKENDIIKRSTRFGIYHLLAFMFSFIFIISNLAASKVGNFWGIYLPSGTLYFPMLYIINDMTTEVYGFRASRRTIWLAIFTNILFVFLTTLAVSLPSDYTQESNKAFDELFTTSPRILVASIASFLFGEYINSMILAISKVKLSGRYFMGRAIFSTFIGVSIESFLFSIIAFYGIIELSEITYMSISLIIIKVIYEAICIPVTYRIVKYFKNRENIDHYDKDTKFNIFQM